MAELSRKRVTVVFCDLVESSELFDTLDPEALRAVTDRYYGVARAAIERHGGAVEKYIGDAVMAIFGIPALHEDDPVRAVRAAVEIRAEVAALGLVPRIGIETGEVAAGDPAPGHAFATGPAVVVAERLQKEAGEHGILVGESTFRLIRDAVDAEPLGALALKGRAVPVRAWRIHDVRVDEPGLARRLDTALVGREQELERLRTQLRLAIDERSCRLVTVIGPAGAGKSRLVLEFTSGVGEARVVTARCPRYGEGNTYRPLADIVRAAGERLSEFVDDERAIGILDALAEGQLSTHADELPWAARTLIESVATERGLVIVLEDVESAEPRLLDLVEYVARTSRGSPVLIVCVARTELLEARPSWANGTAIWLQALSGDESRRLLDVLAGAEVDPRAASKIVDAAGGNALFVEELLRMLVDGGALERRADRWVPMRPLDEVAVPDSVQSVIAARLDHLAADDRLALQSAAVIGQEFGSDALATLADAEAHATAAALGRLADADLIARAGTGFRFGHPLVREVAYAALPKSARAHLHERFARLIENHGIDVDLDGTVGYHLHRAVRARRDLDPSDPHAVALVADAVPRLEAAAQQAEAQRDLPAAASFLERATELLDADDPRRLGLLIALGESRRRSGRLEEADACLAEAEQRATGTGLTLVAKRAAADRGLVATYVRPGEGLDGFIRAAQELIEVAQETHDDAQLARAWIMLGWAIFPTFRIAAMQDATEHAIPLANAAGRDARRAVRMQLALEAAYGPMSTGDALRVCDQMLAEARADDDRSTAASVMVFRSYVEGLAGRFEAARASYAEAAPVLEELDNRLFLASQRFFAGSVELLADAPIRAETLFREGIELLEELGDTGNLSEHLVFLAEALHAQGRDAEAEESARAGLALANPADAEQQAISRSILAEIRSGAGRAEEAVSLAREAVATAEQTDAPVIQARALGALATVLRTAGWPADADEAAGRAMALYEAKGCPPGIAAMRRELAQRAVTP
jgi:class 3 adenylate cyclase/tetratricopeptide (TPR) repeat protein